MAKKAKQQDLKPNVNPDDVAACYTEYASMRADVARLGQKIAAMFGRYAKSGVDEKAIKAAYAASSKDPSEARAQHRRNTEYMAMLDIIKFDEAGQGGFIDGLVVTVAKPSDAASERVRLARIYSDGYNSGLAGGKIDASSHAPGSEAFVRWRDGWTDGHADRLARNPDADKVTQAQPRKRGRGRPARNGAAAPHDAMGQAAGHA